jgi:hypothetical protein
VTFKRPTETATDPEASPGSTSAHGSAEALSTRQTSSESEAGSQDSPQGQSQSTSSGPLTTGTTSPWTPTTQDSSASASDAGQGTSESSQSSSLWTPESWKTTWPVTSQSDAPVNSVEKSSSSDAKVEALVEEYRAAEQLQKAAEYEVFKRQAKRLADSLERRDDRRPVRRTLHEELALPDEEQEYAIDGVLPLGGNALFAGRYKAGKTTFNGQLLRAWADGVPFLGKFAVHPDEQRPVVTFFNYEMSEGQWRRWMRRVGILNTHNVNVVHLRGLSLPLALADVRKEVAGWLRDANTGLWIVDPASRAMAGLGDGSDNKDVSLFTGWLDEIKADAGVRDLVMNIHMGHASREDKNAERAIGAQAWSAWADALWYLTKDKDECRWFHAEGRDVSVDKLLVSYQAEDMSVALVDVDPETQKRNELERAILNVVRNEPWIGTNALKRNIKARSGEVGEAIDRLVREGVITTRPGPNRSTLHALAEDHPPLSDPGGSGGSG